MAPKDILRSIPIFNLPTSPSSTLPSKIILFKSATVAIVVPGLNVFASIAWSPSFTGTCKTVPETVDLTFVFVNADPPTEPSLIICKSERAFSKFC